jgi:hypothetical protein
VLRLLERGMPFLRQRAWPHARTAALNGKIFAGHDTRLQFTPSDSSQAQRGYSVGELRTRVFPALGVAQAPLPGIAPEAATVAEPETPTAPEPEEAQAMEGAQHEVESDAPSCANCAAPVVRRQTGSGANAGHEFWGFSRLAKCRTIVKVSE